jgi:hypothetical protein
MAIRLLIFAKQFTAMIHSRRHTGRLPRHRRENFHFQLRRRRVPEGSGPRYAKHLQGMDLYDPDKTWQRTGDHW